MKECPRCGAELDEQIEICTYCGRNLNGEPDSPVTPQLQVELHRRPDGSVLIGSGVALSALGAILLLIAASSDFLGAWALIMIAGVSFQLGLFLGLAGAIIRALWFLPGEDVKRPNR